MIKIRNPRKSTSEFGRQENPWTKIEVQKLSTLKCLEFIKDVQQ